MRYRVTEKSLISFFIRACILILSYQLLNGSLTCSVPANFKEQKLKENDKFTNDEFLETVYKEDSSVGELSRTSQSCEYYRISKRLICSGSIDYSYLEAIKKNEINEFVVGSYNVDSYKTKTWTPNEIRTGERYLKLPIVNKVLTGKILLKDPRLRINVKMKLLAKTNSTEFRIEGAAVTNQTVKLSWTLNGNLTLGLLEDKPEAFLEVEATGSSDWKIQINATFVNMETDTVSDFWAVGGIVSRNGIIPPENQFIFSRGHVRTKIENAQCRFDGELETINGDLKTTVFGNVVERRQNRNSKIPKAAFSNMNIKSILFKDSTFYNDFDKNSFRGMYGLKRISFTHSVLESFPRLDELLYSSDLEEIYVEYCAVPRLKFGITATLKKVNRLSFEGSGPLNFDDNSFLWLKDSVLQFLNLRQSRVKISSGAVSILQSVNKTLKHLDISHSTLTGERELNVTLKNLNIATLKAEGLHLHKIPTSALAHVRKTLTYLSLKRNDFRKNFDRDVLKDKFTTILNFPLMVNLKELNLEECEINYIEKGTFDNLPNLKILHLSYNNLENIQDGWSCVMPKVSHLSLSHNDFNPEPPLSWFSAGTSMDLSGFRNLEVLDLSNGFFREINKVVSGLGNGLRNLSLRNTRLGDIPDNFFDNLTGLEVLDLSSNRNLNGDQPFSFALFKNLRKLRSLNLKHCKITSASGYETELVEGPDPDEFTLENLEYLDLSENNFKMLDSKILKMFPNMKILNLAGNSISEWRTTKLSNEHLESLFLDGNKIETITEEMFSDLRRLKQVKLGRNPYICGPYVHRIIHMIEVSEYQYELNNENILNKTEVEEADVTKSFFNKIDNYRITSNGNVKFVDWFENKYICYSWSEGKFVLFSQVKDDSVEFPERSKDDVEFAFFLWTGMVVLGVAISFGIICWKFIDIHLITSAVRNAVALSFIGRNEKGVTNFKYNVFVSYSDKDRPWVVEYLLPRLESRNEEQSVCLHERDFQVGLSIIENILNSIENSRNIILVVSQAFLKSQWCQYEMQLAQFRLLEKGRHHLILIFLENIPAMKRPKTLKYLMMTKTYLEWPLNPKNQRAVDSFWNRLMKSLENMNKNCA